MRWPSEDADGKKPSMIFARSSRRCARARQCLILDAIRVEVYGGADAGDQLGTVTVPEPTLLVISPWDPSVVPLIDKAIRAFDLD